MGTATELLGHLKDCAQTTHAVAGMTTRWLGRIVAQAIANGAPGTTRRRQARRRPHPQHRYATQMNYPSTTPQPAHFAKMIADILTARPRGAKSPWTKQTPK